MHYIQLRSCENTQNEPSAKSQPAIINICNWGSPSYSWHILVNIGVAGVSCREKRIIRCLHYRRKNGEKFTNRHALQTSNYMKIHMFSPDYRTSIESS